MAESVPDAQLKNTDVFDGRLRRGRRGARADEPAQGRDRRLRPARGAERFVEEVDDEPELAKHLRIEERELQTAR